MATSLLTDGSLALHGRRHSGQVSASGSSCLHHLTATPLQQQAAMSGQRAAKVPGAVYGMKKLSWLCAQLQWSTRARAGAFLLNPLGKHPPTSARLVSESSLSRSRTRSLRYRSSRRAASNSDSGAPASASTSGSCDPCSSAGSCSAGPSKHTFMMPAPGHEIADFERCNPGLPLLKIGHLKRQDVTKHDTLPAATRNRMRKWHLWAIVRQSPAPPCCAPRPPAAGRPAMSQQMVLWLIRPFSLYAKIFTAAANSKCTRRTCTWVSAGDRDGRPQMLRL